MTHEYKGYSPHCHEWDNENKKIVHEAIKKMQENIDSFILHIFFEGISLGMSRQQSCYKFQIEKFIKELEKELVVNSTHQNEKFGRPQIKIIDKLLTILGLHD